MKLQDKINELLEEAYLANFSSELDKIVIELGDIYCDIRTLRQSIPPDSTIKHEMDVDLENLEAIAAEGEIKVQEMFEDMEADELEEEYLAEERDQIAFALECDSQRPATYYGINGQ